MSIDGILNVNKPEGKTSFSIVALLRRLSGEKHVGHAGTLDPIATGVLPICIGQATRVVQFLADSNKAYLAQIELGITTDTFDREGKITLRKDPSDITLTQIEKALENFQGSIQQSPPVYSAVKYQGRRLYELARAGIQVKVKPRQVKIISNELIDYKLPILTIKVECSKGTYIRSLAHDLGQYLGCGAYIRNLTRIQCGPFLIEDSLPLSEIECIFKQGILDKFLHPVDTPLLSWNAVIVEETNELAIKNGCSIPLGKEHAITTKYCRAYSSDGRFLAVLHFVSDINLWHPDKVFSLD
jgi:tRNA pseudouridine55 synthase